MGHRVIAVAREGLLGAIDGHSALDEIQAIQIRTLDSVSFNAVETAYISGNVRAFRLTERAAMTLYKPAFCAGLATHPLKNPNAPADPSDMPQYKIPQQAAATVLNAKANEALRSRVSRLPARPTSTSG